MLHRAPVTLQAATARFLGTAAKAAGEGKTTPNHVLRASQFDRSKIDFLCDQARVYEEHAIAGLPQAYCAHRRTPILANLFLEPSTRTASSFASAMHRLGGHVISINASTSSTQKGETLEDTTRMLSSYADVIVIRQTEVGGAERASRVSGNVPVLNAGDGAGEHPTQALLDIYSMRHAFGGTAPDGLNVTLLGDLKYGRTVHSLARMLALYNLKKLTLVAPRSLEMPAEVMKDVQRIAPRLDVSVVQDLPASLVKESNVLYVTRVQKERFATEAEYNAVKGTYIVNKSLLGDVQRDRKQIVMHPLPRVDEISTDLDEDPRAYYFQQARRGVFMRMALLARALELPPQKL